MSQTLALAYECIYCTNAHRFSHTCRSEQSEWTVSLPKAIHHSTGLSPFLVVSVTEWHSFRQYRCSCCCDTFVGLVTHLCTANKTQTVPHLI